LSVASILDHLGDLRLQLCDLFRQVAGFQRLQHEAGQVTDTVRGTRVDPAAAYQIDRCSKQSGNVGDALEVDVLQLDAGGSSIAAADVIGRRHPAWLAAAILAAATSALSALRGQLGIVESAVVGTRSATSLAGTTIGPC
jgi:hypothetical protein